MGHPAKEPMKIVAAYLQEKEREIKGVHILTGGFMEFFFAGFLGYVDTEKDVFSYFGSGEEMLDMISIKDAAAFTAEVAADAAAVGYLNCMFTDPVVTLSKFLVVLLTATLAQFLAIAKASKKWLRFTPKSMELHLSFKH